MTSSSSCSYREAVLDAINELSRFNSCVTQINIKYDDKHNIWIMTSEQNHNFMEYRKRGKKNE